MDCLPGTNAKMYRVFGLLSHVISTGKSTNGEIERDTLTFYPLQWGYVAHRCMCVYGQYIESEMSAFG